MKYRQQAGPPSSFSRRRVAYFPLLPGLERKAIIRDPRNETGTLWDPRRADSATRDRKHESRQIIEKTRRPCRLSRDTIDRYVSFGDALHSRVAGRCRQVLKITQSMRAPESDAVIGRAARRRNYD